MKKEIRHVSDGILRVTTVDERWYVRSVTNSTTGLPEYQYVPSVTWICGFYPRGIGFMKWLASTGWDESQAIKEAAGDKGSRVHRAIGDLLDGKTVPMDAEYLNDAGELAPLSLEEYECLMGFCGWHRETKPVTIAREFVVWNDEHGYAGTVDWLGLIKGEPWVVDFKSGQNVWPEYEIQVSAYDRAMPASLAAGGGAVATESLGPRRLGILQVGYRKNQRRWKFTEVEPQFGLFLHAKGIWAKETAGQAPKQRDYPLALTLETT